MNLIESLSKLKDFRRSEGKRYPLAPMLIIAIMSIICGYPRYREITRFAKANKDELKKEFGLKRDQMPSHVTFRELIQKTDFKEVNLIFENWAKNYVKIEKGDWLSIDGKAIASTVSNYDNSYQNFVSLVSIFSHKRGQVLKAAQLHSSKKSEIMTVKELIQMLDLEGVVFTMDALHCQKKL
ncbi:MAG: ISAs1 family transposase [Desulfobacterales bacterium]|nr:ISAs1 family transposase [Desulfobacterales bacterium]